MSLNLIFKVKNIKCKESTRFWIESTKPGTIVPGLATLVRSESAVRSCKQGYIQTAAGWEAGEMARGSGVKIEREIAAEVQLQGV